MTDGPGGDLYVGQLTGAPFPVGAANVYRVPANGGTPAVVATGFTNIIDIAFDRATGVGYVLEHDADGIIPPLGPGVAGRLIRLNANGTQTVISTPGLSSLAASRSARTARSMSPIAASSPAPAKWCVLCRRAAARFPSSLLSVIRAARSSLIWITLMAVSCGVSVGSANDGGGVCPAGQHTQLAAPFASP